mmetsp:Transcript_2169/g.2877  ORF Transcript_2169/g.2877 Transcript_2169/m.2877 type:complete len:104 (+) Transcript_2169:41-352(+)
MVENLQNLNSNSRQTRKKTNLRDSKQFVDFSKLDVQALKRYKRNYKLKTRHNSTKAELVQAVTKHFATVVVNEVEIIEMFLEAISTQQDRSPDEAGSPTNDWE